MTGSQTCWFTGGKANISAANDADEKIIDSEILGRYQLSSDLGFEWDKTNGVYQATQSNANCARKCLEVIQENPNAIPYWVPRGKIEHYRQQITNKSNIVICSFEDEAEKPVDHSEKPYQLLDAFARKLRNSRAFAKFKVTSKDQAWARIVDKEELWTIMRFLADKKFTQQSLNPNAIGLSELVDSTYDLETQVLVGGWENVKIRSSFPNTNKVFIATQFNWPEEVSLHEETINAIKAACKECNYEADVVAQNHTGNITDKIITEIKNARFVIAELTYNNRGVYFESGYARGLGIPVFHVIRKGHTAGPDNEGKRIHFDIQQVMYREWETPKQLESILKEWIEASVGKHRV